MPDFNCRPVPWLRNFALSAAKHAPYMSLHWTFRGKLLRPNLNGGHYAYIMTAHSTAKNYVDFRLAEFSDADNALIWRNQDANRLASFSRNVIPRRSHLSWWKKSLSQPDRVMIIVSWSGVDCGVLRFDGAESSHVALSLYLDNNNFRNNLERAIAWYKIYSQAIDFAFQELGAITVTSEVLRSNSAVCALHRRIGFLEVDPIQDVRPNPPPQGLRFRMSREFYRTGRPT